MNELVSLNTLQTLTNIQQILQVSTGVNPGQTSKTGGSGTNGNATPSAQTVAARMVSGPSAANHDAIFQNKFDATSGSVNQ